MRRLGSGFLYLVLALAGLSAFLRAAPTWAGALGLDVWEVPRLLDEIGRDEQARERMDEVDRDAVLRVAAKTALAQEVAAGRLTIAEAAARFRQLDATATEVQQRAWRDVTPGASDEERYRVTVLRFVEQVSAAPPSQATASASCPQGPPLRME
jgi:hypothetical protein